MPLALIMFIMPALISALLLLLGTYLSRTFQSDREKLSPYECGFDPKNSARTPFSLRFFLLAVIFLIFDIEIAFLFPLPPIIASSLMIYSMPAISLFLLILMYGLLYEWVEGSLEWAS
uniref:NADH-ubiquinone oxidoreductase chain 3 n=1 Tax=Cirriformia cf. tentaculata HK-2018 TaxID=2100094 RepID=A0A343UWF9_9ANNE|nr:NADH dehydrogenase subunit 3 [Cirriformia cf. tentaculata HK-2018]AVI26187.1 NADH dehydrogenase subunit 3 [Cirriformia cf. tentaculata HK-2018]